MTSNNTNSEEYFREINGNTHVAWKKYIPVQFPYSMNLKKQSLGKVLEIGAGLGRNLRVLDFAVGVEHNIRSVEYCRKNGFDVFLPEEFELEFSDCKDQEAVFDSLLMSHVLEHIEYENQTSTLEQYLPYLKTNSKIMLITPQEAGYHATQSHITWTDFARLEQIILEASNQFEIIKKYSFPFPRIMGKLFKYNEFNVVASKK
jgi:hypothetical protein